MVKKFALSIIGIFILVLILNFSFASASIDGADKIRLLSLAMIISILEIVAIFFALWWFSKHASNASKKEALRSFALANLDDGVILYDGSHKVLYLNPKAEEFLGVKYAEVADMNLSPDFSLRNPKLSKLIGAVFFSKPEPEYDRFFVKESETQSGEKKIFVKILKPKGLMQFHQ